MSKEYQVRMKLWYERRGERDIHAFSKELYGMIKEGTLDEVTKRTFKQRKRQMSRVERAYQAEIEHARTGAEIEPGLVVTPEQIKNSDKSKIRSIKNKVKAIMHLSYRVRSELMTPFWNDKLEDLIRSTH